VQRGTEHAEIKAAWRVSKSLQIISRSSLLEGDFRAVALKDVLKTALSAEESLSREEALEEAWEHYCKTRNSRSLPCHKEGED